MTTMQAHCLFCDTPADQHHVQIKGLGGTSDPQHEADTEPLCRTCHDAVHKRGYRFERHQDGPLTRYLLVSPDGEISAERKVLEGFDETTLVWRLQNLHGLMVEEAEQVYFMSHEGLIAAAEKVRELGKAGWLWQAHLVNAAYSRMAWGSKEEKRDAVCKALGFSRTKFFELVNTVRAFPDISRRTANSMLTPTHFTLAARSPDPGAAVEMAEDKLANNGRYPTREMAKDLGLRHDGCPWWDGKACTRYSPGETLV